MRKKQSTLENRLLEYQELIRQEKHYEALLKECPTNQAALFMLALVKRKLAS